MAATTAMQTTQHQTVHDNTTLKLYDSTKQLIYPICHCTCSILHHINTPNTGPSSDQMCQTHPIQHHLVTKCAKHYPPLNKIGNALSAI